MLVDEFAIIIGKRIFFFSSIGECPIEVGIIKIINIYGFGVESNIFFIEVKCWR
jgi:hypothetical protein